MSLPTKHTCQLPRSESRDGQSVQHDETIDRTKFDSMKKFLVFYYVSTSRTSMKKLNKVRQQWP